MKKIYKYLAIATAAFSATIAAQAPTSAPAPVRKHEGLYLNAIGGLGTAGFYESSGTTSLLMTGFAFNYGAKLGAALSSNFVIFGAIDGFSASNPTAKITSGSTTASGTLNNTTYSVFMYGAGLGYYADSNFFINLTAGLAKGSISSGTATLSTESGFGANMNIGQEWWVASKFAIGVAAVAHYSNVKDGTVNASQYYIGIAVSATYN